MAEEQGPRGDQPSGPQPSERPPGQQPHYGPPGGAPPGQQPHYGPPGGAPPGQQPHPGPPWGVPPGQQPSYYGGPPMAYARPAANGMAVAALVCGIVGAVIGTVPFFFWLAAILGVLAVIFGFVALGKANRGEGRKGMSIAGVVLGFVGVVLAIVQVVAFGALFDEVTEDPDFQRQIEELEDQFNTP